MKQNYHLSIILIKNYVITSIYFHHAWMIFFCWVCFTTNQNSEINIVIKKLSSPNVTAGMLSKNFKKTIRNIHKWRGTDFFHKKRGGCITYFHTNSFQCYLSECLVHACVCFVYLHHSYQYCFSFMGRSYSFWIQSTDL